jgi:3'(2'), 5'-bisphosphate nucleotidase
MFDPDSAEVKFAIHAVRQASLLVKQVQKELGHAALTKDDRSPVTVADFASQALVGFLISQTFPDDPLVAEEDASALRDPSAAPILEQVGHFASRFAGPASLATVCDWIDRGGAEAKGRFWTLDPIDGTKGFLRGDQYAVALALVSDSSVQVGVLGCPNLRDGRHPDFEGPGSLVVAARGQGAWTAPIDGDGAFRRLTASSQNEPTQARILRSFEAGHTNVDQIDDFARALGIQAEAVRMDSQAKYALLAAGQGELLLRLLSPSKPNYREKIWDHAAGSLILKEAGGCISDLDGRRLDFSTGRSLANNRGLLASNSHLHAAALGALRETGA